MRREGLTPAVLYGPKTESLALQLEAKELTRVMLDLQRRNAVFNLDISGADSSEKRHVMVKEIQTHPVDDSLVHTDFYEVPLDEPVTLTVPIKYTGTSKGVDLGGVLHVTLNSVQVKGLVLDIPDFFEVDITDLAIGDHLECSSLDVPAGLELLADGSDICVAVYSPKREVVKSDDDVEEEEEAA